LCSAHEHGKFLSARTTAAEYNVTEIKKMTNPDEQDYQKQIEQAVEDKSHDDELRENKVIPNLAEELHKRAVAEATANADASYRPSEAILNSPVPELLLEQVDGVLLKSKEAYTNATLTYQAKNVPIKLRGCLEIPIHVSTSGSVVHYKLRSVSYDIGFGIVAYRGLAPDQIIDSKHNDEDNDEDSREYSNDQNYKQDTRDSSHSHSPDYSLVVVREMARVDSHLAPVEGKFLVGTVPTRLVFTLDNEYSWFREKIVSYEITVTPPDYKTIVAGRRRRAKSALSVLHHDLDNTQSHLAQTQKDAKKMSKSIEALQQELVTKQEALKSMQDQSALLKQRIEVRYKQTQALQDRLDHGWPDQHVYQQLQALTKEEANEQI